MGFIKNLYNTIENKIIRNVDERKLMVEAVSRGFTKRNDGLYAKLMQDAKTLRAKTLNDYKQAVAAASDPLNYARQPLAELYANMLLDNHLSSVIDSRILFAQRSAFKLVNDNDEENTELTWLLERPWFEELIYKVLISRFQGCTLLELYSLNATGELAEIEEIPQPHFNPHKGIITAAPDDDTGWNYKEAPYATSYVQIGKSQDLGMLEKLAPIVLAKKLAMGSYQDYIEKFGIPPIFITTDREDDTRLQQLFTAAQNFKSNHFMVGRGQEKFEIGNTQHGSVVPFDSLITRANDEMSKRILGGAGLTDEKSFVGSSEIQYRLANDRFMSDKLFFKNIFNEQIKPRLIALSPVYKPLENHYFEWDNTESLSMKEIIDAVEKLGNRFEIDPAYVERITGIPVLKKEPQKVPPINTPENPKDKTPPAGGKDEKK